jgi:membrane protease YdiL (CAAX protease family)
VTEDSADDPPVRDEAEDKPRGAGRPADDTPPSRAYATLALVTVVTSAAVFQAFRPDNTSPATMLISLGVAYGVLTLVTLTWLSRTGDLKRRLTPQRGDITIGALVAVGMYLLATGVHVALTSRGSPKEAWLIRVYLQIGDPRITAAIFIGPLILLIGAAEELVWRGLVLGVLLERWRPRSALLCTTALYALSHASTVYLLRDPYIGWNPLVVAAALGCGLVWGWLVLAFDRLSISLVAHALFTWSVVEFPIMNM